MYYTSIFIKFALSAKLKYNSKINHLRLCNLAHTR